MSCPEKPEQQQSCAATSCPEARSARDPGPLDEAGLCSGLFGCRALEPPPGAGGTGRVFAIASPTIA
jgi:hypothetical protein